MADPTLRFDRFCWNVRLTKTRSAAAALAEVGHARLNGRRVEKPSMAVHVGDVLTIPYADRVRVVRILALPSRRVSAPIASEMIEDIDGGATPS